MQKDRRTGIKILQLSDDFWNIRGSFKIAGLIDIGTQASLIRRENGKFVFLDSYTLGGAVRKEVDELTNAGEDVEAVLNLHPFHTIHDGDVLYAVTTNQLDPAPLSYHEVSFIASELAWDAVLRAF